MCRPSPDALARTSSSSLLLALVILLGKQAGDERDEALVALPCANRDAKLRAQVGPRAPVANEETLFLQAGVDVLGLRGGAQVKEHKIGIGLRVAPPELFAFLKQPRSAGLLFLRMAPSPRATPACAGRTTAAEAFA